jgi:hypothetical protein
MKNTSPPKNDRLIAEAKTELKRLGIETEGKRPDQLLTHGAPGEDKPRRPTQL